MAPFFSHLGDSLRRQLQSIHSSIYIYFFLSFIQNRMPDICNDSSFGLTLSIDIFLLSSLWFCFCYCWRFFFLFYTLLNFYNLLLYIFFGVIFFNFFITLPSVIFLFISSFLHFFFFIIFS